MAAESEAEQVEILPLREDERASIHRRIVSIIEELPAIGKTRENTEQRFMFRGHDDVMNALNPLLSKHGVYFVPKVLERIPDHRTTSRGSTMYEVNLHVEFTFRGLAGDTVVATAWGEGTDMGDKSTNKAMTGALKNALAHVFAIATGELSDSDQNSPEETTKGGARQEAAPARGRSRSREQAAGARRAFDPGVDLLDGAIRGEGATNRIAEALLGIDATIDWQATLAPAIGHVFGVETRDEIPEERRGEFWRRLSNAIAKLDKDHPIGSMPPVTEENISEAIAWGFSKGDSAPTVEIHVDASIAAAEQALADEAAHAAGIGETDIPFPDGDTPPIEDETHETKDES